MRNFMAILLLFFSTIQFAQVVPFNQEPDWESAAAARISTGLGLADINGDGWKDMIVADGNDIERQHLTVHYNNGDGSFSEFPDWESDDIDYHGHLATGDLNNDGWIDVAVSVYIGPSGFSEPGRLKVYYNEGGALESTPSFESMPFYTFSCALGDADGDGDLDIGLACGEPYGEIHDKGRIYLNNNGSFSDDAVWESDIEMAALDVEFGDMDHNSYLDIVFTCEGTPNYIYFADGTGLVSNSAGWVSTDSDNYINSVDIGYRQGADPGTYLVMTGNDQLGGEGRVKMYSFVDQNFETTPSWESDPFGYGSGILLYGVMDELKPDLVYGGWWRPIKIALNTENGFELNTSYTSSTNSVVEAILVSDLGKESIIDSNYLITDSIPGNIIVLPAQVVENIQSVSVEDVALSKEMWKHIPGKAWLAVTEDISLNPPILVKYQHSPHGDIVITNWDSNKGNYIFYNTNGYLGQTETDIGNRFYVHPNPARDYIMICPDKTSLPAELIITNQHANRVHQQMLTERDPVAINTQNFPAGVYYLKLLTNNQELSRKIIIIH